MLWKIFIIFHVLSIAVYLLLGAPRLVLKIAGSRSMDIEQASPSLWIYDPSFNAAVTVALVYLTSSAIHILQAFIYRSRFCIVLVIGGIWEILGYCLRAASTKHSDSTVLYATQLALVVLAPAYVAAFNYMLFGRLLRTYSSDPKAIGVLEQWVTRAFLAFDVISFIIQSTGAAMLAGATSSFGDIVHGQHIIVSGLLLQLSSFGIFTAVPVRFHLKMARWEKLQGSTTARAEEWRPLIFCLYASCFLIIVRSTYRVIEFFQGLGGHLGSHEVYFYSLEALPMMLPFILFNIWHPGRIVKGGFLTSAMQPDVLLEDSHGASRQGKENSNEAFTSLGHEWGNATPWSVFSNHCHLVLA